MPSAEPGSIAALRDENEELLARVVANKRLIRTLSEANQTNPTLAAVLLEVGNEVGAAEALWPPMNSAHEAFAVLDEERDELWAHVMTNQKRRDIPAMRKEAIQLAAMAICFVRDICDAGQGRK